MTMRMTLPNAATRAQMLATNMEQGMEMSYVRLEGLFASLKALHYSQCRIPSLDPEAGEPCWQ